MLSECCRHDCELFTVCSPAALFTWDWAWEHFPRGVTTVLCRVFMVVGKKYDMICLLNVHVQCISMHCKHTTHHDNDKSVWLWFSGYDMLLIWIGFKSSKRNVMRYTCYVSSATFYCHLKLPWWNSHYIMAYLYVASASGKSRNFCCIANKSSRKNESKCVYECV